MSDLVVYTEVIQDAMLDLIDAGKLKFASGTAFSPSPAGMDRFYKGIDKYRKYILLRPEEVSNSPEVVHRLGVIAMNTALEVDIYGNINSTHVTGTKMMNGIGGSGDFARNAYLTIFYTPSTAKGGKISSIVPFCSHIDQLPTCADLSRELALWKLLTNALIRIIARCCLTITNAHLPRRRKPPRRIFCTRL